MVLSVTFNVHKKLIVTILLLVQRTIGDVASIADKVDVRNLFKEKMLKLYKCTRKASKVGSSKNSHSMQIDDASNNLSPSILRCLYSSISLHCLNDFS